MRGLLLGYLLNALEPEERQRVEDRIERDANLERELELFAESLQPLQAAEGPIPLPAGLADRTCHLVAEHAAGRRGASVAAVGRSALPAERGSASRPYRLADFVVAVGVVLAGLLLLFPALEHSHQVARLTGCQDNLHRIGLALAEYARDHHGYLPSIPADETAGIYAVRLKHDGYLLGDGWNLCPGAVGDDSTRRSHIPTPAELRAARGVSLVQYQRTMGGSYGYTLHYVAYGRYHCVKVSDRPTYAIMADAPSHSRGGLSSANHGRCGQNVLYEDGHIQYLGTLSS